MVKLKVDCGELLVRKSLKVGLWSVGCVVSVVLLLGSFAKTAVWAYLSPPEMFDISQAPKAPDYQDSYFWVSHPDKTDSADLIPPGIDFSQDYPEPPVDVFFIHSTGYVGPGGWNSTMSKDNSEAQSIEYMLSSMASIYNGCCRIYAPHYREAHLQAFLSDALSPASQALDLAYTDVKQAFDYFLTHFNHGRPFIIVSHSQGTAHALRLLEQEIDTQPIQQKLVAAYVLGYWLPLDKFSRSFRSLTLCQTALQTGCIISYDSYGEGGTSEGRVPHWYTSGWEFNLDENGNKKASACVNPLSWQTGQEKVAKTQHLGAMPVEFKRTPIDMLLARNPGFKFSQLPPISPQLTWAQCQADGRLEVAQQHDNAFSNHLDQANRSYHVLDFSLFYANLRQNAMQRTQAYLQQHP
jgi:hypothetical protein